MKRINTIETVNNPGPIPGCHAPEDCWTQSCGPLDLGKLLTESPCVALLNVFITKLGDKSSLLKLGDS